MKLKILLVLIVGLISFSAFSQHNSAMSLSQDMLMSYKMNQPITDYENELAGMPFQSLVDELNSDLKKQAFWVNIYITYSQKLFAETEVCDKKCKRKKVVTIANKVFSLNDILYKILLHSKCAATGGKKPIAPKWEKSLRVSYPDGRVLFAIDSHPKITEAITYYESEKMDQQLNDISTIFLQAFIFYDSNKNEVFIPEWLKHFKREFGKSAGIIAGLKKAEIIPAGAATPKIIYSDKIATLK
jgi:hypothetical protein